jgi:hypothetical protein
MSHEREPLTPEEREIAQRLARLDAGAAPSAALDARILAAACAGAAPVGARPAPPVRRSPGRWPIGLGVAASLLVAVGLAWQLRPQPEQAVLDVAGERPAVRAAQDAAAPEAATRIETTAPARRSAADIGGERPPAAAPSATQAEPSAPARAQTADGVDDREAAARQARDERSEAAAAAQRVRVREEAASRAARANAEASGPAAREAGSDGSLREAPAGQVSPAALAAEAAPASPPAAQRQRAARSEESGFVASPAPPPPAPPAPPTPRAAAPAPSAVPQPAPSTAPVPDRIELSGTRPATEAPHQIHLDQPLDEQPPASADSPAVRESWLQRIRELRDGGREDEARESLREFMRRHPQAEVPVDLRALLDA